MRITGIMARRLLVNWRIPPACARRVLPAGVHPKIVAGYAIAGLCLVRLEQLRPVGMPAWMGLTSENLAVRMGVEWTGGSGVLIFRRETASRVNAFVGARTHYGEHHRGVFRVQDDGNSAQITASGYADRHLHHASVVDGKPDAATVFADLPAAERFFRGGECGYSPGRRPGIWEGLRLHLHRWDLRAMRVLSARSTMIDALFDGKATLDSAFIMRDILHTWSPMPVMHWGPQLEAYHRMCHAQQSSRHAPRAVDLAPHGRAKMADTLRVPSPNPHVAAEHEAGISVYPQRDVRGTANVAAKRSDLITKWLS